ncbi:hypothetical protein FRC09_003116 [Ceratobasidium sp. 395]|nr:hypothetical protein FRC09_003116 [Ceratobasidium sp. 395]
MLDNSDEYKTLSRDTTPSSLAGSAPSSSVSLATDVHLDSSSTSSEKPPRKYFRAGKSMQYRRKVLASIQAGEFVVNHTKWALFEQKILALDKHAIIDPEDPLRVRHSACGNLYTLKEPYQPYNFEKHCKICTAQAPAKPTPAVDSTKTGSKRKRPALTGAGMKPLTSFFKPRGQTPPKQTPTAAPSQPPQPPRCPGLRESQVPGINKYITRVGSIGGGGRSYTKLAKSMFDETEYANLSERSQAAVAEEAKATRRWKNSTSPLAVYSSECKGTGRTTSNGSTAPCASCSGIASLKEFKNALRHKQAAPERRKFTNRRWIDQISGLVYAGVHGVSELFTGEKTPAVTFAKNALAGKYKSREVFFGLVQTMDIVVDKEERGVGRQNTRYPPAFDDFCHTLQSISTFSYQTFAKSLAGRTVTSFQSKRARDPKFPLTICAEVFQQAKTYIDGTGYSGPVCLSCDDSKLFPALQTYYTAATQKWHLVGGVNGPVAIADNEALKKVLSDRSVDKASKIRLWVIQIPLPGIPPFALAALPIGSNASSNILIDYLTSILDGLLEIGIHAVSYAADGGPVEQGVQTELENASDGHQEYKIPHPRNHQDSSNSKQDWVTFRLDFYRGKPLVRVQDSKHALKNCRNNLFSGARLLVLGSTFLMYSQVREIAFDGLSTLFHRDVENLDRQDDYAAERLFNALTLAWILRDRLNMDESGVSSTGQPSRQYDGLAVYLYILGELIDAYQSRHIDHGERIKMALRAKFFLQIWSDFLLDAGYDLHTYFISHQTYKILSTIIDGLILLIYVYRDHLDTPQAFLPWLHSTEACEHMFAEMRKLVDDFTYLDFLFAVPKLRVLLRASYARTQYPSSTSFRSGKAEGYTHTYMDMHGVDLNLLSTYPTDSEIKQLSRLAYLEATQAAEAVGIRVEGLPAGQPEPEQPFSLPSIDVGFPFDESIEPISDCEAFQQLVDIAEKSELPYEEVSVKRDNLIYATAALLIERSTMIDNLPFESKSDILAEQKLISTMLKIHRDAITYIPAINEDLFAAARRPLELNFSKLIHDREAHQTEHAAHNAKNYKRNKLASQKPESDPEANHKNESQNNQYFELARAFAETLQAHEITTKNSSRLARWTGDKTPMYGGNKANARLAAEARASTYIQKRRDCLRRHGVTFMLEDWATGRISALTKETALRAQIFVWVLVNDKVTLARVLAVYVRQGGKSGTHAWEKEVTSIGNVSYLAVQLYQPVPRAANQYRATHFEDERQIYRFYHVPINQFLMALTVRGIAIKNSGENVELALGSANVEDFGLISKDQVDAFILAMEALKKSNARTPQEAARAAALMSRFPGSRRAEDVATRYEVPIGQTSLADLFKMLSNHESGEEGGIEEGLQLEYSVEKMGLESVFLKVIQDAGVVEEVGKKRCWKIW